MPLKLLKCFHQKNPVEQVTDRNLNWLMFLVNTNEGCKVYDCVNKKPFRHSYCSPYACTSETKSPIEIEFDVSRIRKLTDVKKSILHWTVVNPPHENDEVQWEIYNNNTRVFAIFPSL